MENRKRVKRSAPPKAELTLLGIKCCDVSENRYRIKFRLRDEPVETMEKIATSRNRTIAKVEVIAEWLCLVPHLSAAIPADNMFTGLLLPQRDQVGSGEVARPQQVALKLAQGTLLSLWSWAASADCSWLIGTPVKGAAERYALTDGPFGMGHLVED